VVVAIERVGQDGTWHRLQASPRSRRPWPIRPPRSGCGATSLGLATGSTTQPGAFPGGTGNWRWGPIQGGCAGTLPALGPVRLVGRCARQWLRR